MLGDRTLLALMLLGWLASFYAVPEGLAAPYAHDLGGGAVATGLLLAAQPCGAAAGVVAFSRWVDPARRARWMGPLAALSCAPLVLCALRPGLVGSIVVLAVAGTASAFQLAASASFVQAVPDHARGQAYGLANAGLAVGQGAAIGLAGVLATRFGAAAVIAASGALGATVAAALAASWARGRRAARIGIA